MTLNDYAAKWSRPRDTNFAVACYDMNTVEELLDAEAPDETDMETWGITDPQEWRDAIAAALHEKLCDVADDQEEPHP